MRHKPSRKHRKSLDRRYPMPRHIRFLCYSVLWAMCTLPIWFPSFWISIFGKAEAPSAFEYVKK